MNITAWLALVSLPSLAVCQCPIACSCQTRRMVDAGNELITAMTCSSKDLKHLSELALPATLLSLNVSNSGLMTVYQEDFLNVPTLTSLNLSHNDIQYLLPGAFLKLGALRSLDLSSNNLESINATVFEGLKSLQHLSLSYNKLRTVPELLQPYLTNLRLLDFNSAYVVCDCNIQWILRAKRKRPDFQVVGTQCSLPTSLRGVDVQAVKRLQLQCDLSVELQEFEVVPSSGQIVFAGDSIPFVCYVAADYNQTKVYWLREGMHVATNQSQGIVLQAAHSAGDRMMRHSLTLTIERLQSRHTGAWKCQVDTPVGTVDKTVNIIVISESTAFCAPLHLRTNKGTFSWPKTMAGVRQELPCDKSSGGKAYHQCGALGQWQELNLAQCKYIDIITRTLEELSGQSVNETTDILKVGNSLQTLLTKPESIQDKMDVVFIARFLSAASRKGPGVRRELSIQIAYLFVNITSMMMNVNRNLLQAAQREEGSCSSIVRSLERVLVDLLVDQRPLTIRMENVAVEVRKLDSGAAFPGLCCAAYSTTPYAAAIGSVLKWSGYPPNNFECRNAPHANVFIADDARSERVEALLHVPMSAFGAGLSSKEERKVVVLFYRNDNLFQRSNLLSGVPVLSTVMSCGLVVGNVRVNVSAPLTVGWRSSARGGVHQWPARWDGDDWSSDGCVINQTHGNLSIADCLAAGSFAVLQDVTQGLDPVVNWQEHAIFKALRVPFYIGTVASIVAMFVIITTYCVHFSYIQLSKKLKHCIINTCICILLLDVIFAAGIRTRLDSLCKAVGISIHYLSICVVFWITVTSWTTYKKLRRHRRPDLSLGASYGDTGDGSMDDGVAVPPPPKPMLKFYLFAWGIPIIICGITAAVNINFYNTGRYCFLAWDPSLLAFYGVVGLFVLINCLLFLCMSFTLSKKKSHERLAAAAMQLEEVYPLDDSHRPASDASSPSVRMRAASVASSVADEAYRPGAQMAGIVLLLLLYMLVWGSGALAIAAPFEHIIPNMEEIFGYMYMGFSIILGLFVVIFYCFARSDTRWRLGSRKRSEGDAAIGDAAASCGTQSVAGGDGLLQPGHSILQHGGSCHGTACLTQHSGSCHGTASLALHGGSMESGLTSKSVQAIDLVSTFLRAADARSRQACSAAPNGGAAILQAGGVAGQMPGNRALAAFYNPRQNGIARKYWEKASRLQRMKQLTQSGVAKRATADNESTQLLSPMREGAVIEPGGLPRLPETSPPPHRLWQRQRLSSAASEPPIVDKHSSPRQTPMATPDILAGSPATAPSQCNITPEQGHAKHLATQYVVGLPTVGGSRTRHKVHHSDNELDTASPHSLDIVDARARRVARTLGRTTSNSRSDADSAAFPGRIQPGYIADSCAGTHAAQTGLLQQQPRALFAGGASREQIPDVCKDLGRAATAPHRSAGESRDTACHCGDSSPASTALSCRSPPLSPTSGTADSTSVLPSASVRGVGAASPVAVTQLVAPSSTVGNASAQEDGADETKAVSPYACISVVPARTEPSNGSSNNCGDTALANGRLYANSAMIRPLANGSPIYENISELATAEPPLYENVLAIRRSTSPDSPPIYENIP